MREAPAWLGHCEAIRDTMGFGGAQLFVVTQRCMAPCWSAASYIKPAEKEEQRAPGRFSAEAEHLSDHVYHWMRGTGQGLIPSSGPPAADIQKILSAENAVGKNNLPYNICVGIGGLVVVYKKTKRKPLPRRMSEVPSGTSKSVFSFRSLTEIIRPSDTVSKSVRSAKSEKSVRIWDRIIPYH